MYRILVADDEALIRQGIQCLLDYEALGFTICGEAASGETLLLYRHHCPHRAWHWLGYNVSMNSAAQVCSPGLGTRQSPIAGYAYFLPLKSVPSSAMFSSIFSCRNIVLILFRIHFCIGDF